MKNYPVPNDNVDWQTKSRQLNDFDEIIMTEGIYYKHGFVNNDAIDLYISASPWSVMQHWQWNAVD